MRIEGLYDRGYLVNFKQGDQALYRTKLSYRASVADNYHTIREGESLLEISRLYYKTDFYWYILSDANEQIEDIFDLPVGTNIVIPNITTIFGSHG